MLVTFATKTSKGHERNNTGEKTFACKICDKIGTFKGFNVFQFQFNFFVDNS